MATKTSKGKRGKDAGKTVKSAAKPKKAAPTVPQLRELAFVLGVEIAAKAKKAEITAKLGEYAAQFAPAGKNSDKARAGTVQAGVRAELDKIRKLDAELADGALAMAALSLAREMDLPNSATAKSNCGRALIVALEQLRDLTPEKKGVDGVDRLNADRESRRGGSRDE